MIALQAAIAKAEALGVPQNITIVDDGGNMLAYIRMDGAKLLSAETSKSQGHHRGLASPADLAARSRSSR